MYHVGGIGETNEAVEILLGSLQDHLVKLGVAEELIGTKTDTVEKTPLGAIAATAGELNAIVVGASDPTLATFVFGLRADKVADRFRGPVLIVEREPPEKRKGERIPPVSRHVHRRGHHD